jgi:hypothetical protein
MRISRRIRLAIMRCTERDTIQFRVSVTQTSRGNEATLVTGVAELAGVDVDIAVIVLPRRRSA